MIDVAILALALEYLRISSLAVTSGFTAI